MVTRNPYGNLTGGINQTRKQYCTDCRRKTIPEERACENRNHVNCKDVVNECGNCGSLNIEENTGIRG
jgi:hypothetical protein